MEVSVNEEYRSILPPLTREDYEALKNSIREKGLHYPITVNQHGVILDGYHRYKACLELGVEPRFEVKNFDSPLQEKLFVIEANLHRRHLNDFQKAELLVKLTEIEKQLAEELRKASLSDFERAEKALPLLEVEKELAKQRLKEAGKLGVDVREGRVSSNELTLKFEGEARDVVARKVGLSPITFQRAVAILQRAPEELREKVRRGEVSIAYAYEMLRRRERPATPPLPEGEFNVIYADPPWEYALPLRGSPDMHYPVMSTEEICRLRVPAAKDAVLFLWATNPKLEDALKVLRTWGFAYKTNMVWVKDRIGTGYYFRGQHELLLVGVKGNFSPPIEENRPPSVLKAPAGEHSEKPAEVYAIIERMYPHGKYLELFARRRREGWTAWGL